MPTGKGAGRIFKIATAQAEHMGYTDFSEGSMGRRRRDQIAEAIARKHPGGRGLGRPGSSKRG